jgi:hypothetical protein
MDDLGLWHRLGEPIEGDAVQAVVSGLRDLAGLSVLVRAPWLGRVAPLVGHASPEVRAAAVRALGGCRGITGVRAIVAALDDDDDDVRSAGLAALHDTAKHAPLRFTHALFHPRAAVRAAAVALDPPHPVADLRAYLRGDEDPAIAEVARAGAWPKSPLVLVLDMFARGMVTADEAADALGRVPAPELRTLLLSGARRSGDQVRASSRAVKAHEAPPPLQGHDLVDGILRVIDGAARPTALLRAFVDAVIGHRDRELRRRVAVAVLEAARVRTPDDALLGLAGACMPAIVVCRGLPRALRSAALSGLGTHREQLGRVEGDLVRSMLDGDLVRDESGALVLSAIACVAGLLAERRVAELTERFGAEPLVAAVLADAAGWEAMCRIPEGPAEWILEQIAKLHRDRLPEHLATALVRFAASPTKTRLETALAGLAAEDAGPALSALLSACEAGRLHPTTAILERVVPVVAKKMRATDAPALLREMLGMVADPPCEASLLVMVHVGRRPSDARIGKDVRAWDVESLRRLTRFADLYRVLRHDKELAVARALRDHPEEELRAWAEPIAAAAEAVPEPPAPPREGVFELSRSQISAIIGATPAELKEALKPAIGTPALGVARALADRPGTPAPDLWACVALVGAADDLPLVARALDRFHDGGAELHGKLREAVVTVWQGHPQLPMFAHAWLHRWEAHAFPLLAIIDALPGNLLAFLRTALALPGALARRVLWEAAASVTVLRRYREKHALDHFVSAELVDVLVEQLDTELGAYAGKMLVALEAAGQIPEVFAALPDRLRELAPDMDRDTRHEVSRFVRIDGLPERREAARRIYADESPAELARLRASEDLDELERVCLAGRPRLVHEAALRLIELGGPGQDRLCLLLQRQPRPRCTRTILESIPLWSDDAALSRARDLFAPLSGLDAEDRFRLALAFAERGETEWGDRALEVAVGPSDRQWFLREDWIALVRTIGELRKIASALAGSDQPNAYQLATAWLLGQGQGDPVIAAALRTFLLRGSDRPTHLRHGAARYLHADGDPFALPLVIAAALDSEEKEPAFLFRGAGKRIAPEIAGLLLDAAALAGTQIVAERRVLELVELDAVPFSARRKALRRLLVEAMDASVRKRVVDLIGPSLQRDLKLIHVAEIFAWGVRRGRELTGRLFRVHMTTKRTDLGYTRFTANRIFVSPLPVLMGERHGRDVVEALVLHELGHHVYHTGEGADGVWKRAQTEGLHSLLNLVADEHLERNLRAVEASYGDRLKRLAAYAFQHSEREIPVLRLLGMLLSASAAVLSARPMGVAHDESSVIVQRGFLLRELERTGHPFARFVRALRMGLGDRHGDPILQEALALFTGGFRKSDMAQLYAITKRLAELYGGAAALAEAFGGHEGLEWGEREGSIHGEGIGDDDVQREVERILDPRQIQRGEGREGPPGKLAVNVNENTKFDEIKQVEKLPPDPEAHRLLAQEVRRASERLRDVMRRLGLAMLPQRARLRGRSFDRTRARAVVLRRDPRMLVAREVTIDSDLFIGIVVDCSGSMQVGTSMNKAHRFGVLIAEAVRSLPGVDARFFGFTDRVIYDAGDARSCAVTSLKAGGGNNDAAALYHVAKIAAASRRRAKLLVMISDGLPTECSVAALRNLVDDLTRRRGMCCAQVAVRPLAEICFPHHIVLDQDDIEASTRRFGEVVSRLVGRAIGR